jgi:hypothetical protein
MTDIPFIAVGAEELGEHVEEILCPHCGHTHPIKYGTSQTLLPDGALSAPKPCSLLGYYMCDGKAYLATLNGRLIK